VRRRVLRRVAIVVLAGAAVATTAVAVVMDGLRRRTEESLVRSPRSTGRGGVGDEPTAARRDLDDALDCLRRREDRRRAALRGRPRRAGVRRAARRARFRGRSPRDAEDRRDRISPPSPAFARLRAMKTTEPAAAELGIRPRDVDQLCVDTIRMLAVDMWSSPRQRPSRHADGRRGHGLRAVVEHLRYDPSDPHWRDRDRFVLSAGHACALHYALLHLAGFDLPMEELRPLPSTRFEDAGTSRSAPHAGHRVTTGRSDRASRTAAASPSRQAMMAARFNRTASTSRRTDVSASSATAASWRASPTRPCRWRATGVSAT